MSGQVAAAARLAEAQMRRSSHRLRVSRLSHQYREMFVALWEASTSGADEERLRQLADEAHRIHREQIDSIVEAAVIDREFREARDGL